MAIYLYLKAMTTLSYDSALALAFNVNFHLGFDLDFDFKFHLHIFRYHQYVSASGFIWDHRIVTLTERPKLDQQIKKNKNFLIHISGINFTS